MRASDQLYVLGVGVIVFSIIFALVGPGTADSLLGALFVGALICGYGASWRLGGVHGAMVWSAATLLVSVLTAMVLQSV